MTADINAVRALASPKIKKLFPCLTNEAIETIVSVVTTQYTLEISRDSAIKECGIDEVLKTEAESSRRQAMRMPQ